MDWMWEDVVADDGPSTAATPFLNIWHTKINKTVSIINHLKIDLLVNINLVWMRNKNRLVEVSLRLTSN